MARVVLLFALAALAGLPTVSVAADPTWRAGAAAVVITPEKFMWMSGYGSRTKPAEGKASDLYAKALFLDAGGDAGRAVLITLDLVGIDRDTAQKLTQAIREKYGLARDRVILSVSHTHCGPVVGHNLRPMYFFDAAQAKLVDEYTDHLHGLILEAVDKAQKALAPATITSGHGFVTFATNRRNNKEPEVPALRPVGKLQGPVDHDVPVLCVRDPAGAVRAVVFGYACHATTLSFYQWCADWPGFAQTEIEAAHPGAVALFWAGCGADQNPLPRQSIALAQAYGKELAQGVEAVIKSPMKPVKPVMKARYTEIDLPLGDLPTREAVAQDMTSTNKFIASRAKMLFEELRTKGTLRTTYPYPVQVWRLGDDLTWVTLGGEVVVDYALRLKKELGDVWVTAYANDLMAYIPSRRVLKEGGYEGATSMIYYGLPTIWSPKVEDMIVETTARLVKDVREGP
ncbi:neutral/alkaline non-lysosomal ceramidase N-terminal domain-containing protein [Fimbriiglobus ruber]|uniref:Alkaline ceramidase domain protein n=1 Tax=Fimbriiglobus ruber TaxID=1908690 RepID=A0A225D7A5_9BACT|nr:neutral/alkaline non-lysosomal ceramidase N-terminal domain-containing protein [Fimbriiglobus ruber]OWK37480.1 Alkaline ceramidase domain protein [Fimbriiglobus ruber]